MNQKIKLVSQVQLRNSYFIDKNIFSLFKGKVQLGYSLNIDHNNEIYDQDKNIYLVNVKLNLDALNNELQGDEAIIYQSLSHYFALFEINSENDEELEVLLKVNAPSLIFPYVRQHLHMILESSGLPKPLIQPIAFDQKFLEEKSKE